MKRISEPVVIRRPYPSEKGHFDAVAMTPFAYGGEAFANQPISSASGADGGSVTLWRGRPGAGGTAGVADMIGCPRLGDVGGR